MTGTAVKVIVHGLEKRDRQGKSFVEVWRSDVGWAVPTVLMMPLDMIESSVRTGGHSPPYFRQLTCPA